MGLIKNDHIWREANIEPMTTVLRQKRLRWNGHVLRKEGDDTTKKRITVRVQGRRRTGRPKKRWLGNIREEMKECNMTEEMADNRSVRHMNVKTGPLLLYTRRYEYTREHLQLRVVKANE